MSNEWGRVAIVTPTWKRRHLLPTLYDAFINQTFKDWTQLVIYADPADLAPPPDPRIRSIHHTGHPSGAQQRNTGISHILSIPSRVEYLCNFDDDDLPMPTYLELLVLALEQNPQARYASCSMRNHDGRIYRGIGSPCFLFRRETVKPNWSDEIYENDRKYVRQFMTDPTAELIGDVHVCEVLIHVGHSKVGGLRDPAGHN